MRKWRDSIRHHFHEIAKVHASPHAIALGFVIGTLIGILPTLGVSILLGLLVIFIFENINKLSLFAALAFWNPITMIPIYISSYKIGDLVMGNMPTMQFNIIWLNQVYAFTARYLIGNIILAIVFSLFSYVLIRKIAEVVQKRAKKVHTSR